MENQVLEPLLRYLPLLIPIVLLELGLMVAALLDLVKREHTLGPKWMWILIVALVNLVGSIVYFGGAVALLGSTLGRTIGAGAGIGLALSVVLLLAGSVLRWGTLTPAVVPSSITR